MNNISRAIIKLVALFYIPYDIYRYGTFSVKNLKTNTYIYDPTAISFGSSDTMDVVLAAAVDGSGNYYRICKCKYFHFDMKTL